MKISESSVSTAHPSGVITRASFPLFQMIYNQVMEQEDRPKDLCIRSGRTHPILSKICRMIREMDNYHMELVYAIIRCYHLQVDRRPIFEAPYQMRKLRSSQFRFEIDNLPSDLILILGRFVDLYEKKKQDHPLETDPQTLQTLSSADSTDAIPSL